MLSLPAVDPATLGLIIRLQSKEYLKGFHLVGGTDFLSHRYPLIFDPLMVQGISMLSVQDIIAMKLNAIVTSGQRVKDFIDIYFLLEKYNLTDMLLFYRQKYALNNDAIVLKSLVWFIDVELSEWPVLITNPKLNWPDVKKRITKAVREVMK